MSVARLANKDLTDKEQPYAVGVNLHTLENFTNFVGRYDAPSQPADGVEQQVVGDLTRHAAKGIVVDDGAALLKRR